MIAENQRLIKLRTREDELTCIVCPIGCRMRITPLDGDLKVEGNRCKRGEIYAREEFSDPRRVVTATCALTGGESRRLAVKSSSGVPVEQIPQFLNALYELRIPAPVESGDIIAENLGNSGVDLVSTMTVHAMQQT